MPFNTGFFTNQQVRTLKLLMLMRAKKPYLDYKSICQRLNCSFLTLQTEIANLHSFPEVTDVAYISPHLKISYKDQYGTKKLYQSVLQDSPALRLLEILFYKPARSLDDLAEHMYMSLSTLKRLLNRTNQYLMAHFQICIDKKHLTFTGEETAIRLFFLKYFSESYDCHIWPLEQFIREEDMNQLVSYLLADKKAEVGFALHRHLKLLVAINFYRQSRGYYLHSPASVRETFEVLTNHPELRPLSKRLSQKYQVHLSDQALSDMLSPYYSQRIVLNSELIPYQEVSPLHRNDMPFASWLAVLDQLEAQLRIPMANKDQIVTVLNNAYMLGKADHHHNFLIYDPRQECMDFFKEEYPYFFSKLCQSLEELFKQKRLPCPESTLYDLVYILVAYWDNLYVHLSQMIQHHRLLVIEKGTSNVGQFLKAYAGQFFDIAIFKSPSLDVDYIRDNFDLVLTDIILPEIEGTDIYYFNKLIPSIALERLNHYLVKKVKEQFATASTSKSIS
ncbi:helix-turn-helix domain-containing protein [Streptococcus catagoni]|uniref:helix-turn-helix domain-containing protein n=1 Tax=Streptococcus catagoni TaxID=2654874 RepID=UPI00140A3450|nr:helix-turn-helix domain-containing protein [Streptococcus catagoni]